MNERTDAPGFLSQAAALLRQIEAQLDNYGAPGWIAAIVLGFLVFLPLGLLVLAYVFWSGRMRCGKMRGRRGMRGRTTGNAAFDAYRQETLDRLEEERAAFEGFLTRLRRAKDQAEFDQFMDERRGQQTPGPSGA